jgi:DinB family protein
VAEVGDAAVTPDLEELLRQIEAVKADGQALCAGLSESQFNWRPAPGRWSIAECLAHLNLSVTGTLPAFDRAIETGRAKGRLAPGPFRYRWFARMMVASMEPPPRYRMKAPTIFTLPATTTYALRQVLPDFLDLLDRLAERVRRADGLDLARNRVISPVTTFLRVPMGAYFQFILAHERRHLWQARQVRNAPTFGC